MANWNTIQSRFTEGELSPLMYGQSSNPMVKEGCQTILNGVVTPQGPVVTRFGTSWITDYTETTVRLWSFVGPENKDYIALFRDDNVDVLLYDQGLINGSTGSYTQVLLNNNFTTGVQYWNLAPDSTPEFTGYVNALNGQCRLQILGFSDEWPLGYQTPIQTLDQPAVMASDNDDFVLQCTALFTTTASGGPPYLPDDWKFYIRLSIGTTLNGSEIGTQDFELDYLSTKLLTLNATSVGTITAGTTVYSSIQFFGVAQVEDAFVPSVFFWQADIDDAFLNVRPTSPPGPVTLPTVYGAFNLEDLHFVQSPYSNRDLICLHPDYPPQTLYYDSGLTTWIFEPFTFVNAPSNWGPDFWPSIGAGIQGRLALTGVGSDPEVVWLSKPNDWTDFDLGTGLPADAIEFTGQLRDVNTWLMGGRVAFYGDQSREYDLTSSGPLDPADLTVSVHTSYGTSRNPQKILMGRSVVLPSGGNNDMRLMRYSREAGGYIAPNIILKADHLGRKGFRRNFYSRDPYQILWSVMEDRTLLMCAYDGDAQITAWTQFVTQGEVEDGCVVTDSQGRDVTVLAIVRNGRMIIEVIDPLRDFNQWEIVDSAFAVYPPVPAIGQVGGFDLYEGQEVAVFLDGRYTGMQTVVGGEVYSATAAAEVKVGYVYPFKIETFPQSSLTVDSGMTSKKRYSKVGLRGLFSVPPIINGQRAPDRWPQSLMDEVQPPFNVLDSYVVDMDINEQATITVEEELPVRVTVAAIFGKLTSNQL